MAVSFAYAQARRMPRPTCSRTPNVHSRRNGSGPGMSVNPLPPPPLLPAMIQSNLIAHASVSACTASDGIQEPPDIPDTLFMELLAAYRRSGGLARGSEVAALAAGKRPGGTEWLEHCCVHRLLVSVRWNATQWVPLFQFKRSDMSLRVEVLRACAELRGVMDDCELAVWFVRPQCGLHHCSPLDLLDAEPDLVVDAARREHFFQGV